MTYNEYAELEIGLHRREHDCYAVELRYTPAHSDADVRLSPAASTDVRFDPKRLRSLQPHSDQYGQELTAELFDDRELLGAFEKACASSLGQQVPLRLRLFIAPSASDLHSLHWETLRDPRDDSALATQERIVFSRYLSSVDWGVVPPRRKADLRALVAIANPWDLLKDNLQPVDVAAEKERARAALGDIPITELAGEAAVTLDKLAEQLRLGYDIVYLVAHGAFRQDEPKLWLEDDEGASHVVSGRELVVRFKELQDLPRLVVLASCESSGDATEAGEEGAGALAALGPLLAEAGVPAVIAMQGRVSMATMAKFMPTFFRELQVDGRIDRAIAVARGVVREQSDWWAPVVFMRLKSGRLWYTTGFAGEQRGLEKWPALLSNIDSKKCTPIIGPGVSETLLGSRRKIARRWAETYSFPMAPHNKDDLPQVAQFLSVTQQSMFPHAQLLDHLRKEILQRYRRDLRNRVTEPDKASVSELISEIGSQFRKKNPGEPHQILAELELPIYVTTNPGTLMADALRAAGKSPRVEFCRWRSDLALLPSIYEREPDYRPTPDTPLVYHLFGHLDEPDSLVLTEDDFFDYLIGVSKFEKEDPSGKHKGIPAPVKAAMTNSGLLFIGFQLEDWDFRILFRSILGQEGGALLKRYAHVAVQLDPEEGRILEPEGARRYLDSYFHRDANISIYWGDAEGFLKELQDRRGHGDDGK